jgi:hypothetical protein
VALTLARGGFAPQRTRRPPRAGLLAAGGALGAAAGAVAAQLQRQHGVDLRCGVELAGFVGALLAIPAAGVIQVIARDIYDHRRGQLKPEPTVGTEEVPLPETGT